MTTNRKTNNRQQSIAKNKNNQASGYKNGQGIAITDLDSQVLLQQSIDYYQQTLLHNDKAKAYLSQRGLYNKKLINHFNIGFGDRSLTASVPRIVFKAGKQQREALRQCGLLRPNGREQLYGCLTFPIINDKGDITNIYGYRIKERAKTENRPAHYLLTEPLESIFNRKGIDNHNSVLICHSFLDVLSVWQQGLTAVTVNYIENTAEIINTCLLQYLIQNQIKTVYLSGQQAHQLIADQLQQHGIHCYRLDYPYSFGLHSVLQQAQDAKQTLVQLVRRAECLSTLDEPLVKPSLLEPLLPKKEAIENLQEVEADTQKAESAKTEVLPIDQKIEQETITEKNTHTDIEQLAQDQRVIDQPKKTELTMDVKEHEVVITIQDRAYRVRGLNKNLSYDQLKINLRASKEHYVHVDSFDFYLDKPRERYIQQAAKTLYCTKARIQNDMGLILLELEKLQNIQIENSLNNKQVEVELTPAERESGLALLQDPNLIQRIRDDIHACGMVGEAENSLLGYLCFISRKLAKPLAMMIQSTSAAGKSTLMNNLLAFVPNEHKTQYSAMTSQSLYYMEKHNLKHHILAIAEESGASDASYALKLLQSEGEVSIASTSKDSSGNHDTQTYRVEGPVMLSMTSTAIEIDDELLNRCIVLTVNENRQQTKAIHAQQRQNYTLDGIKQKQAKKTIFEQHHHAQRLLKNIQVVNPYANHLTFMDDQTRTRRDHEKYLTLINSIALLHQYQRKVKTFMSRDGRYAGVPGGSTPAKDGDDVIEYIEVEISDITLANELAHYALGRSLDELPPQPRELLRELQQYIEEKAAAEHIDKQELHLMRKQIREITGRGDTQLKEHLRCLVDMEYLALHKDGNRYCYELLYDGKGNTQSHVNGLIDSEQLHALATQKNTLH